MAEVKFTILSRKEAESLTSKNIKSKRPVMISINDAKEGHADIKLDIPILYLQFDDVETTPDWCLKQDLAERIEMLYDIFDFEMAKKIIDFVNVTEPDEIIVHCHAGICRSAAVAAALKKIMYNDDKDIFVSKVPNMLVYTRILQYYFCRNDKEYYKTFIGKEYMKTNQDKFSI